MTGFTETVKWELASQGIDATVFELGAVKTEFVAHMTSPREVPIGDYDAYMRRMIPAIETVTKKFQANAVDPVEVASSVYRLVHMKRKPFRYHPNRKA